MTRVLGIILARGGSRRLPGKNIRPLGGIPLIAWTIRTARAAKLNRLILSTDSEAIAEVGRQEGVEVPFMRPAWLATSEASSRDAVLHGVDSIGGAGIVVLLQPTSPFRKAGDIDAVIAHVELGAPAAVSACAIPYKWNTFLSVSADGVCRLPVVDVEPTYRLNGSVYAIRTEVLRSQGTFFPSGTKLHEMSTVSSIDIDTIEDFQAAEAALESGLAAPQW